MKFELPSEQNIAGLNADFAKSSLSERIAYICEVYGTNAVLTTSLGAEDQVILDAINKWLSNSRGSAPRIATLDTGRLHDETYKVLAQNRETYPQTPIEVYFPKHEAVEVMVAKKGINLFRDSVEARKECCAIRKVEPLGRALGNAKAWVSGLRRSQSTTRDELVPIVYDEGRKLYKISPLFDWSLEQVMNYIKTNKVPKNELHDKGFPSIGCAPCTRAIKEGEDERAGRWWWESPAHKECGIHQDPLLEKKPARFAFKAVN